MKKPIISRIHTLKRGCCFTLFLSITLSYAQFNTIGDAIVDNVTGIDCYLITPDEAFQAGAVWNTDPIDLREPFELYFSIFLGCKDDLGADGITFVLNQVNDNIGLPGLDLGFTGLVPSLGIEIDDYENAVKNDPPYDHISIFRKGVNVHGSPQELAGPVPAIAGEQNIEDCNIHQLRVSWNTQTLEVYIDCDLRVSYTGDIIQEAFNNNPIVYYGFTGATGAETNPQGFCPEFVWQPTGLKDTVLCQGDGIQVDAGNGINYDWNPKVGISDPTVRDPLLFPDVTTTYEVTVTLPCGVQKRASMTIEVPEVIANAGPDKQVCEGEQIQIEGTASHLVAWAPAASLSDPAIANPIASPAATTTYTMVVTDPNGCTATDDATVEVFTLPAGAVTPDTVICEGDVLPLFASGGTTYQWSPADVLDNPTSPTPLARITSATVFEVTITNANNCVQTENINVFIQALPTVDAGEDLEICEGDTVELTASGGVTYQWEASNALSDRTIANPLAFPQSNTIFTVSGTDNRGCRNIDELIVSVTPSPTVDAGEDQIICEGDSIRLSATGALTYSWTPSNVLENPLLDEPLVFPDSTTTFSVEGTDALGCSGIDQITISVSEGPTAVVNEIVQVCEGDSVQLTASGGIAYNWFPNENMDNPFSASPFTVAEDTIDYTVEVTDANGCTDTALTTIFSIPLPRASAGSDLQICEGDSVRLLGTGGERYVWLDSLFLNEANTATPLAFPNTSTDIILEVTNGLACVDRDTISIIVNPAPTLQISQDTLICPGSEIPLIASGGTTYNWAANPSLSQTNIPNPLASPEITTTYEVSVTDDIGCQNTASVLVTVLDLPDIDAGLDMEICSGDTALLQAQGDGTFEWFPTEVIAIDNNTVFGIPEETTLFSVVITDEFGCQNTDSVLVSLLPLPSLTLEADNRICEGDSVVLSASGADFYRWFPNTYLVGPDGPTVLSIPDSSIVYTLTGIDNNGCEATEAVNIQVVEKPVIESQPLYQVCPGEETILLADSFEAEAYLWSNGDENAFINVSPLNDTSFWVMTFRNRCPSDTFEILVDIYDDLPQASFILEPNEGDPPLEVVFTNNSQGATSYTWAFADGNTSTEESPIHTYLFPGTYIPSLIAENEFGCRDTFSVDTITVFDVTVYIPNAFSPNVDGVNDEFDIRIGAVATYEMRIFDRWGREVFFTFDPNSSWDGTSQGVPLPEGVYVYYLSAQTYDSKPIEMKGSITLMR